MTTDQGQHKASTSEPLECLGDPARCDGPVEWSGSPDGRSWPRCGYHAAKRWSDYEASTHERYAASDVSPWPEHELAEFGERWSDDY